MNNKADIYSMTFKRKCSVNLYKSLKLKLGEMSFSKDWLSTDRGDMYPVLGSHGRLCETLKDFCYNVSGESFGVRRLLGQFFPYANYDMLIEKSGVECGFSVEINNVSGMDNARLDITEYCGEEGMAYIKFAHYVNEKSVGSQTVKTEIAHTQGLRLIVSCKGNDIFVYLQTDKFPVYVCKTVAEKMPDLRKMSNFTNTTVSAVVKGAKGGAVIGSVEFYLDCGISQADMRPIRYEDGMPYMSDGKVFFTMSSRLQEGCYQSVISWKPSTCEFALEGAVFYDAGDDIWANDVAASVIYNRMENIWQLWVCSFSHGHVLGHGVSRADLRYGINVVDIELMKPGETNDDTLFAAKENDEDPDFVYDKEKGKWYMTICRVVTDESGTNYRYFMYESEKPFEGYRYVTHAKSGAETGGSIVKIGGKYNFVCGSDFDTRAMYHVYDLGDFSEYKTIRCDYNDGGFRGWGTILPIPCGNRTKYAWLTFDRHGGSDYTWSYGNIYVYESDIMNPGYEFE